MTGLWPGLLEPLDRVRPDVPGSAGDQHVHGDNSVTLGGNRFAREARASQYRNARDAPLPRKGVASAPLAAVRAFCVAPRPLSSALVNSDPTAAEAVLRRAGLRRTPVRVGVIQLLARGGRPTRVPQILAKLKGVDSVTVYRTLGTFARKGLVHRVRGEDRTWMYALGGTADDARRAPPPALRLRVVRQGRMPRAGRNAARVRPEPRRRHRLRRQLPRGRPPRRVPAMRGLMVGREDVERLPRGGGTVREELASCFMSSRFNAGVGPESAVARLTDFGYKRRTRRRPHVHPSTAFAPPRRSRRRRIASVARRDGRRACSGPARCRCPARPRRRPPNPRRWRRPSLPTSRRPRCVDASWPTRWRRATSTGFAACSMRRTTQKRK